MSEPIGGPTVARDLDPSARPAAAGHGSHSNSQRDGPAPIPPDWQPTQASIDHARIRRLNPASTVEDFRDHWVADGAAKLDWDLAFRDWCDEIAREYRTLPPSARANRAAATATVIVSHARAILRVAGAQIRRCAFGGRPRAVLISGLLMSR